jgi:bifunctional non-homologous end joining protein LigD
MAAVYSVRPTEGARVSTPVHWDEVSEVSPEAFTIHTVPDRVRRLGDLFAGTLGRPEPIEALEALARDVLGRAHAAQGPRPAGRERRQAEGVKGGGADAVMADATSSRPRSRSSARA